MDISAIEKKWQKKWKEEKIFATHNDSKKPKYYILDMFPYPSGAGLHVGHTLGYIASDIIARYKRMKGFNVLHPMGFDALGLPAEQYAIQTGQHPAITTEKNINFFKEQLEIIGLSFDWAREIKTCDSDYYKWTQWIFIQLYHAWYNHRTDKAEPIDTLIQHFEKYGSSNVEATCDKDRKDFTAEQWKDLSEKEKQEILLQYRLVYRAEASVNWCPDLGSVLAHDEVINGYSERGNYPVFQKKMMQWMMRITAYSERLLKGLDTIDWPDALKDMQKNWIGKSIGASVKFKIEDKEAYIETFTTRIDTIYGVSFIVIAPEHPLVKELTKTAYETEVEDYLKKSGRKSDRERSADVKTTSGVFTGSYVLNPINNERVPIWVADYVLMGYGTGCVMGVPSGDQRDYLFAQTYQLPIVQILDSQITENQADPTKEGRYVNSGIINGMEYEEAANTLIEYLENKGAGKKEIQYKMRDAVFGRQRYWGEPIPVYYKDNTPYVMNDKDLPLVLPEIDAYLPTKDGDPPLGRAKDWKYEDKYAYELTTMPGWAGSSWYWLRYMDPKNKEAFASEEAIKYWGQVDFYLGGDEHAVGHLMYSRFWNKVLKDLGLVQHEEPFKKLVNQGKILGHSTFIYRIDKEENDDGKTTFISYDLKDDYLDISAVHVPIEMVDEGVLDIERYKKFRPDLKEAAYITNQDGVFLCGFQDDKMSKSKHNTVSPEVIIEKFGADAFRMYMMFLGPLEYQKPWNTGGIEGVAKFTKKLQRLFFDGGRQIINDDEPTFEEYKILHKAIKKTEEDIERLSLNTCISNFMICVNALTDVGCHKKKILEKLILLIAPFAPHICEELWKKMNPQSKTIAFEAFPDYDEKFLKENEHQYPISINGKTRKKMLLPTDISEDEIKKIVLEDDKIQHFMAGRTAKKIIVVKGRIVNIVL